MAKVLIIGGGVAGLSAAIFLQNAGLQVVVKERVTAYTTVGHGFILQRNGIEILDKLGIKEEVEQNGTYINEYVNRTEDNIETINESLSDNIVIKRNILIDILAKQLPKNSIHFGYKLKSLEWKNDAAGSVVLGYENGESEEADLVIGADGASSIVRSKIFPFSQKIDAHITEIVGVCTIPDDIALVPHQLLKIQEQKASLAMGILQCNKTELIWYLQYDSTRYQNKFSGAAEINKFILAVTKNWPQMVSRIFKQTNFNNVYTWQTGYLELLPSFHKKNIVLLGDAAHTLLPFTSQGANSALVDADVFCSLVLANKINRQNCEDIFNQYYNCRKDDITKNIAFGSKMTDVFIHPEAIQKGEIVIPLALI